MTDLQSKFNTATDLNDHTFATVLLNQALLLKMPDNAIYMAYSVILGNIQATHDLVGYMPSIEGKMRDAIQSSLVKDCRLFGLM